MHTITHHAGGVGLISTPPPMLGELGVKAGDIDCNQIEPAAFEPIFLSTLEHNSIVLSVIRFGATVVNLDVPDQFGHMHDVLLGFENTTLYCANPLTKGGHPYFGATIGRVANRVRFNPLFSRGTGIFFIRFICFFWARSPMAPLSWTARGIIPPSTKKRATTRYMGAPSALIAACGM
jgi:hypothetical protein